jgi:hypothetical protein
MGIPDGAHTHGSGSGSSGGLSTALLVLVGAALAVKLAGPAAAAVGELVHVLLVVVAVVGGAAGACLLGFCAWRLYRWRHEDAARTLAAPPSRVRAARPLPEPQPERRAIEPGQQLHLHFHGTDPAEVAEIIRRQHEGHGGQPGT